MRFSDVLREILQTSRDGLTPQVIRERIKDEFPDHFGTEAHKRNVEKGHYKDLNHALLAQIYVSSRQASDIYTDKSTKPLRLSLFASPTADTPDADEEIESEDLAKLEQGVGTLYVFGTYLFTKDGDEIVKVGITTGDVQNRINQLFTTNVPYRFRVIEQFETRNYAELEQSMHKMLEPFRINRSREFFTDRCLPYVKQLASIHAEILDKT